MQRTVLHVNETTGPGGGETVIVQIAAMCSPDKIRHIVAIPNHPGWMRSTLVHNGVSLVSLPLSARSYLIDFALLIGLIRIIRANDVSVVHSHTFGTSLYCCLASLITRTSTVCTLHGDLDLALNDRLRRVKFSLIRWTARRIICVSHSLKRKLLESTSITESRISVIHNGVDPQTFTPSVIDSRHQQVFTIGAIGNIRSAKAYDVLIRATAIAARDVPEVRLVIVGEADGPLADSLRRLADDLKVADRITFMGFREDVPQVLQSLDLFVLSSLSEGFSIATVQAMASALPVVATRSGGPEEIITSDTDGVLVPVCDAPAIAAAIVRLSTDSALRKRIGLAARETASRRFSLERMLRSYAEVYTSIG